MLPWLLTLSQPNYGDKKAKNTHRALDNSTQAFTALAPHNFDKIDIILLAIKYLIASTHCYIPLLSKLQVQMHSFAYQNALFRMCAPTDAAAI